MAFFDPRNFKKIQRSEISEGALVRVSKLSHIVRNSLAKELRQISIYYEDYNKDFFASSMMTTDSKDSNDDETYDSLSNVVDANGTDEIHNNQEVDEDGEDDLTYGERCKNNDRCRCCIACCLELLNELNQYGSLHSSLFAVYKFILTLLCTQVSCERVFSILKLVKHRLRSSLGQEFLTSFISLYDTLVLTLNVPLTM